MIVDTEKVLREADGPEESDSTKESASGGKVFAPGCARESEKKKAAFYFPAEEWVLPGCVNKRA